MLVFVICGISKVAGFVYFYFSKLQLP